MWARGGQVRQHFLRRRLQSDVGLEVQVIDSRDFALLQCVRRRERRECGGRKLQHVNVHPFVVDELAAVRGGRLGQLRGKYENE